MTRATLTLFIAYLALASTRWIVGQEFPDGLPSGEAWVLSGLTLCVVAVAAPRRWAGVPSPAARWSGRGVAAAFLFGCAWASTDAVGTGIPGFTRTALLALVPVGIVLMAANREESGQDFLPLLGACLAGVGGIFLLLPANPEALSRSPASAVAFMAVVAALAGASYLVYPALRYAPLRSATPLVLLPGVVLHSALGWNSFHVPMVGDLPAIFWQAAEMACLLLLLRSVPPVALSARFLLVPLLVAGEGLVFVRPELTWRIVLGAGLLVFGSLRLLRRGEAGRDSSLSLR